MVTTQYTVDQLTEVSDALLKNVGAHIKKEFDMGRITGTDYAQVYIAGIQSSLAQAQQFLLSKDAQGYQVDLLAIQKEIAEATKDEQIALTETQLLSAKEQYDQQLTQGQLLDTQLEVGLATKQDQIDTVASNAHKAQQEVEIMLERHGMNWKPEFTQGQ